VLSDYSLLHKNSAQCSYEEYGLFLGYNVNVPTCRTQICRNKRAGTQDSIGLPKRRH